MVEVIALMVSAVHAYEGRPTEPPRPDPEPVARSEVRIRAGLGIVGDRYFNQPAHRAASVTFFAVESLPEGDPLLTRRNIIVRGVDVDLLARDRADFSLDTGDGPVRFRANTAATPCRWLDTVLVPGTAKALRGLSGARCTPLDDGTLRLGAAAFTRLT
ncbi:molybdenum cofactor biosysynthesis protein [Actinokineospora cianjurensis]|uniref:MOSC domain-containing protein n=1 Tax=Actinokineospora cianjurensis TaxID=585224 RepID=A0A421AWX3_9PSEU|nr:molybdenum cofactor biosysynthesis protein [Actinokineospora cianjurensis]RLK54320.1 hypothetical protein CLV68_5870 [Actinokineospora cianjurensis]